MVFLPNLGSLLRLAPSLKQFCSLSQTKAAITNRKFRVALFPFYCHRVTSNRVCYPLTFPTITINEPLPRTERYFELFWVAKRT